MLQFFHDSNLQVGNTQGNPKRFVSPLSGLVGKTSVLYLADPYEATLTSAASIGATTLNLSKTDEFLPSGTAQLVSEGIVYTITYTSKTISTLVGVSGITAAVNINSTVKPWKIYKTHGNITFTPRGPDLANIQVSLGANSLNYNFPGSICILPSGNYDMVLQAGIPIYISVGCSAGDQEEFINWSIVSNPVYTRDKNDTSAITAAEVGNTITAYGYLFRRNNYQVSQLRLLPNSRAITKEEPGFVFGKYRWRDNTNVNVQIMTPSVWDPNINDISTTNFISGIGNKDDLALVDIENVNDSIYLRIKNGFYWSGPIRYFLPATPQLQFVNANQTSLTLTPSPNQGLPVFVGVWVLDNNGFYRTQIEFRYQASGVFNTAANAPKYQYCLNKQTNLLNLNTSLPVQTYFLGLLSGRETDYFTVPTYPVDSISSVFVDRGIGNTNLFSSNFVFDRNSGTVKISSPTSGTATSIPNALKGEPVYAVCNPAYAISYDSGQTNQRLLTEIDLNPAFSGVSSGYVYLQHRRQEPTSLTLSSDKPIIVIPATYTSIIDLIAYGPIYYDGDYSLLTVEAFGPLGNEIIPNAEVYIIPGSNFSGTINYQDPTTSTVTGITGSDGKVNFLYVPDKVYGYYIPKSAASGGLAGYATTHISNDSLVLPTSISIDQVYNTREGWLVGTYNILNTDPLLGLLGGLTIEGQVPFTTVGVAGTTTYKTNGEKSIWNTGGVSITPIDAVDINGYSYTNSLFNGQVIKLVYSVSLVTTSNISAYFVNFIQRVSIQVGVVNSDIVSNTILLEMAVAQTLDQDPWLILNSSTQGILNTYRLGYQIDN